MAVKDLDLLDETLRAGRVDSLPEHIARLRREIDKGLPVYTREELAKLEKHLAEYEALRDVMQHH